MGISVVNPSAGGGGVTEIEISAGTSDETPTAIWTDTDGPRFVLVEAWVVGRETGLGRSFVAASHIVASNFQSDEGTWSATDQNPQSPGENALSAAINGSNQLEIRVNGQPATNISWSGKLVIREAA